MHVPKFWTQVTATLRDEHSRNLSVRVYGWSDESMADAESCARRRAQRMGPIKSRSASQGWYQYADRPIREPILEEHTLSNSRVLITRTRYGSKVLNTDRVAFIDIDVYADNNFYNKTPRRHGFLARLLGRPDPMIARHNSLKDWFAQHSSCGLRLYRTPNGFRGILTHALSSPTDQSTHRLMQELGVDPLYMRLCRSQECFRARLNAKPWRIDAPILAGHYPFTFSEDRTVCEAAREHEILLAQQYDAAASKYAACHFVEQLGYMKIHPDVAPVIQLHDQMSGALTALPLA